MGASASTPVKQNQEMSSSLNEEEQEILTDLIMRYSTNLSRMQMVEFMKDIRKNPQSDNNYPIRWAISCGNLPLVKYLISRGVNPQATEVLEAARDEHQKEILAYLKSC